jgi:hypothetical protein
MDLQTPEMDLPECNFQTNYQSLKNIYKVFYRWSEFESIFRKLLKKSFSVSVSNIILYYKKL